MDRVELDINGPLRKAASRWLQLPHHPALQQPGLWNLPHGQPPASAAAAAAGDRPATDHAVDRWVLATLRYIHANPKAAGVRKGFHDRYSNYGHYEGQAGELEEIWAG
jgi:hypothetical protein